MASTMSNNRSRRMTMTLVAPASSILTVPRSFVFKVMRSNEILDCLADLGIELTKEELDNPKDAKQKVRKVFLAMLENCAGKTEQDFKTAFPPSSPSTAAGQGDGNAENRGNSRHNNNIEHHDASSFSEVFFFLALTDLLKVCGYHDFSWRDLTHPDPKRLREQLSAVINLARLREEQLRIYAEMNEPRRMCLEALDETTTENAELHHEFASLVGENQNVAEQKERILNEVKELEFETSRYNKLLGVLRQATESLSKTGNSLKDEMESANWALQEAAAEHDALVPQVVSSPERIRNNVEQKKHELDTKKAASLELEAQLQESKTKSRNVQHATQRLVLAQERLAELSVKAKKYEESVVQLEATLAAAKKVQQQTAETAANTVTMERNLSRVQEQLVHQRKQQTFQVEAATEALHRTKSQLLHVEQERRAAMSRVDECEQEVRVLEQRMQQERQKNKQEIEIIKKEYQTMQQAFLERDEQRLQAILGAALANEEEKK